MPALVSALDQLLADRADNPDPGAVLVDADALAELERDAERGRHVRRDQLIAAAINDGRITLASRVTWATLLDTDPVNTERILASLRKGTIPTSPIGYSNVDEGRDELYSQVYGGGH